MTRRDAWPLGAVGFVLTVSVAWWAFALWPSAEGATEWLERARAVCFNLDENGLPDAKGWLLLLGQPPAMLVALMVGWGSDVRASFGRLLSSTGGRLLALGVVTGILTGLALAGGRVMSASVPDVAFAADEPAPETYPRLDRPWPAAEGLVDQGGRTFDLHSLEGRPAFVTFAFGHCVTLCPAVVHQARAARLELGGDWPIVVMTLDPWRDVPSRLPHLVEQYDLDPQRDFVVSGSIEDVGAALDGWKIPRQRDELTGDITHPSLIYLVESDGTVAYGAAGGLRQLVSLARRTQ